MARLGTDRGFSGGSTSAPHGGTDVALRCGMRWLLFILLSSTTLGCAISHSPITTHDGGRISPDEAEPSEGSTAACPSEQDSNRCALEFGDDYGGTRFSDTTAFISERWALCNEQSEYPDWFDHNDAWSFEGISFDANGRFRFLESTPDGWTELDGLDHKGKYWQGLNGVSSMFMELDSGLKMQVIVRGSACPSKMRLRAVSGPVLEYVRIR